MDRYLIQSWLKQQSVLIIALVLSAGVFWWVQSYTTLWRHIMPGNSGRASLSTRPHDVILRVASKGGKLLDESLPPMEWKLRLPRTYVTRWLGTNGVTYRRTDGGGDEYFVSFQIKVSDGGDVFIPTAGLAAKDQKVRSIIFRMRNIEAIPSIRSYESCIPQHLEETILEPRGDKMWNNVECIDRDLRCRIRTQVDGWRVDLAVTKDLYSNPENTCRLAKQFLNQYTLKRDDIR